MAKFQPQDSRDWTQFALSDALRIVEALRDSGSLTVAMKQLENLLAVILEYFGIKALLCKGLTVM